MEKSDLIFIVSTFTVECRRISLSYKMPLPEICKDFKCETCTVAKRTSGMSGAYKTISFKPNQHCITMDDIIDECRPGIDAAFEEIIRKRLKVNVNMGIQVLFHKINFADGLVDDEDRDYMSMNAMRVQYVGDLELLIDTARTDLEQKIENYTNKGSNWIVAAIEQLIFSIVEFN